MIIGKKTRNVLVVLVSLSMVLIGSMSFVHAEGRGKIGDFEIREKNYQTDKSGSRYERDEIIVKFKGKKRFHRIKKKGYENVDQTLRRYRDRGDVEYAEPNYTAYALSVPNDPLYGFQWHFDNNVYGGVGAESAWDTTNGSGVVVAVVDTGVAYETYKKGKKRYYLAPDLAQTSFVAGYDFVENDTHPNDDEGHGTHVAGTIAQSTNNNLGVAGLAFGASIMPVKVLNKNGSGSYADISDGIRFAADNGADVINLSLGGPSPATYLEEALAYAYSKGVVIIAASGNDGTTDIGYPAGYDDYVIAVGATRFDETRSGYSNYGSSLDIVAPGGDLSVDQNGDGYGDGVLQQTFGRRLNDWGYYFYQGTSMATPHVAGLAALILSNGNATTADNVRSALEETADDLGTIGRDDEYGHGIINAPAALLWTLGSTTPPPPPPPPTNLPPVANAGSDQTVEDTDDNGSEPVTLDGTLSSDPDGTIISYEWSEGATVLGTGATLASSFAVGVHTVTLTVTDDDGATDLDSLVVTVNPAPPPPPPPSEFLFEDSFEAGLQNWTQNSQNDWFRSSQRSTDGNYSAEVDGRATDATITTDAIDLQGFQNVNISFDWLIENRLDKGEYIAFDVSTDGSGSWSELGILKGNEDQENVWHNMSFDVSGISELQLRFRGKMSSRSEDANVDNVVVVGQ